MEQTTVNERIKMLVEHFSRGNKAAFARAAGISNQSLAEILGSRQSSPSFTALQKMLNAFPQVRIEWFVFGRGPMLQDEAGKPAEITHPTISPEELQQIIESKEQQQAESERTNYLLRLIQRKLSAVADAALPPEQAKRINDEFTELPSTEE